MNAKFRYTFPITRAESRDDGLYLVGEASGPEIDSEGERMAPQAVERFASQITEAAAIGNHLPYRDAHARDGVFRDLGELTSAWVDERFHLGVEVKLDEDNPAALFLFRSVQKGKQFGMSVGGKILDFKDEVLDGARLVRTYYHVVLDEISNTTRPAWTPSLGTVLSKAIDEAKAESVDGDNPMEELQVAVEAVEETLEESPVDEAEAVEAAKAVDTEPAEETVDKAGRAISTRNAAALREAYEVFGARLRELGVLADAEEEEVEDGTAKSDSDEPAEELETVKAEQDVTTDEPANPLLDVVEDLRRALAETTAANAALAERVAALEATPAPDRPGLIERAEPDFDPIADVINTPDRHNKLVKAFMLADAVRESKR